MIGPDLCAACVAVVLDPNMPHYIERSTVGSELGQRIGPLTPDAVQRLITGDIRISTPIGPLSMLAVTTVNGTRLCAYDGRTAVMAQQGLRWPR